ncbi:MAG TPA: N-acetyltransferase [Blastocatellia bacterium]
MGSPAHAAPCRRPRRSPPRDDRQTRTEEIRVTTVRPEKPEDVPAIRDVIERAFGRAAEADLVDALRGNGKAILSLVAECDGQIAGHIFFTPATIRSSETELIGAGLAPLAVIPDRQNQGIGSTLVEEGLKRLREGGYPFVIVLGLPDYYPRLGFVPASRFNIKSEFDVADEAFMAMELQEGALRDRAGIAQYQPEFNEF